MPCLAVAVDSVLEAVEGVEVDLEAGLVAVMEAEVDLDLVVTMDLVPQVLMALLLLQDTIPTDHDQVSLLLVACLLLTIHRITIVDTVSWFEQSVVRC